MKPKIIGVLIILFLFFSLVPQEVRAYNPVEAMLFFLPIYYGIIPFTIGFIAGYIFKKLRPDKSVKTKVAIILIIIGASIPVVIDFFYFHAGGISIVGPPLIISALLGFFSVKWKSMVKKLVAFFLVIPLSFIMFPVFQTYYSAIYTLDILAKTSTTPPPGFVEMPPKYYKIQYPTAIEGKLAYAGLNGTDFLYVYDGKEFSYCSELQDSIKHALCGWFTFNGSECHLQEKRIYQFTPRTVIQCRNQIIGDEYDDVSDPIVIGGKLAYIGMKNRTRFIVFDGKEFGNEYSYIKDLSEIDGKLAYVGIRNNRSFIVYDGTEIGRQYDGAYFPFEVNGKLTYVAIDNGKEFIVHDGKEVGKKYYIIGNDNDKPKEVNGKITFMAHDGNEVFIVYGDREIGKEYYDVRFPFGIDGKLGFVAVKDNNPSSKEIIVLEQ